MAAGERLERALHGLTVAMVTPYKPDGSVDLDAAAQIAEWVVDGGADGVLVGGTTGEIALLAPSEVAALASKVAETVGSRALVVAGLRAESLPAAMDAARRLVDAGADALLVPPPCYYRPGIEGLREFYTRLAERVDAPMILYNIPSHTGVELSPNLVSSLAQENSNIVALKATTQTPWYVAEVRRHSPRLPVLAGLDEAVILALNYGATGAVLASANVSPTTARRLLGAWLQGQYRVALEAQEEVENVMWALRAGRTLQGAIKAALKLMGLPIEPRVRPPLPAETEKTLGEIERRLRMIGLI